MKLRNLALAAGLAVSAALMGGMSSAMAADCHADVRVHFLPQFGAAVAHRHQGNSCTIVLAQGGGGGGDCHHDVRRHFLPGYGKVWHRHGPACGVILYPAQSGPAPGIGGCIQIGPTLFCGQTP